jgi:hypothetical protein
MDLHLLMVLHIYQWNNNWVAFDRDNLTLEFYKNGVSQGTLLLNKYLSGLTDLETYFAMCGDSGGASHSQVRVQTSVKSPSSSHHQQVSNH